MRLRDLVNSFKPKKEKACNSVSFVVISTESATVYNSTHWKKHQIDSLLSDDRCKVFFHESDSMINTSNIMNSYLNPTTGGTSSDTIVYIRDDVYIKDDNLIDKLLYATSHAAIVGCAGSKLVNWYQPGWQFLKIEGRYFTLDDHANMVGRLLHTSGSPLMQGIETSNFGACHVVDDTLIAINRSLAINYQLTFDPHLGFNFSTMDFCLSGAKKGLKIECIPMDIYYHASFDYFSLGWQSTYLRFQDKWRKAQIPP